MSREENRSEEIELELIKEITGDDWQKAFSEYETACGGFGENRIIMMQAFAYGWYMRTHKHSFQNTRTDNPTNNQPSKNMTTENENKAASDLSDSDGSVETIELTGRVRETRSKISPLGGERIAVGIFNLAYDGRGGEMEIPIPLSWVHAFDRDTQLRVTVEILPQ